MAGKLASARRMAMTRFKDWAKFSGLIREPRAAASLFRYWLRPRQLAHLVRAYQLTEVGSLRKYVASLLQTRFADPNGIQEAEVTARWNRFMVPAGLTRSIILKAPGPGGEKGVLLLTAEYNWLKLLTTPGDFTALDAEYTVLMSAGWSPIDYMLVGLALRQIKGAVYIEPANQEERPRLEALSPRVKCVPTNCSSWVNPDLYRPKADADRQIDILMVANWAPFKRHWHFFSALTHLPSSLRITMIGQPDGPFRLDRVKQQARDCGVRQQIDFREKLPIEA